MNPVAVPLTWKNVSSEFNSWLHALKIDSSAASSATSLNVIFYRTKKEDKKSTVSLIGNIDSQIVAAISSYSNNLELEAGKMPSGQIIADGKRYACIKLTDLPVTKRQVSRQAGLDLAKLITETPAQNINLFFGEEIDALALGDGLLGGSFKARAFKGEKTKEDSPLKLPESINFISKDLKWSDGLTKKLKAMTEATTIARSLQDAPPNWLTPVRWADIAHECAKDWGIKVVTKTKAELEQLGMGSFLSVAQGSLIEPRLICFEIDGEKNDKTVAFVGKGLTFDAGGISLKPAAGMEEMKFDMSGGAAVFGTACYFARVKPKCKVVCLIGAVENMPSGTATRPSDIVRAMNGKTIEILNTDAEGRLVLADVLHYAETTYKPTVMLDIATLTGACVIALGRAGAGFLTPKDKAAEYFTQVTEKAGEPFWRLPLWPELSKEVKSEVADLKNIAKPGVMAGTILAAVFLKEFVEKTDWIHCDIAGTSDNCAATGFNKDNGSSYGLRTFVEFVEQIEQYPT